MLPSPHKNHRTDIHSSTLVTRSHDLSPVLIDAHDSTRQHPVQSGTHGDDDQERSLTTGREKRGVGLVLPRLGGGECGKDGGSEEGVAAGMGG